MKRSLFAGKSSSSTIVRTIRGSLRFAGECLKRRKSPSRAFILYFLLNFGKFVLLLLLAVGGWRISRPPPPEAVSRPSAQPIFTKRSARVRVCLCVCTVNRPRCTHIWISLIHQSLVAKCKQKKEINRRLTNHTAGRQVKRGNAIQYLKHRNQFSRLRNW